jgi:hypothetical protein
MVMETYFSGWRLKFAFVQHRLQLFYFVFDGGSVFHLFLFAVAPGFEFLIRILLRHLLLCGDVPLVQLLSD